MIGGPCDPSVLRIATYNPRDLGDPSKMPEEERDVARVMKNVNADVWLLQEVRSGEDLDRFAKQYRLDDKLPYRAFFQTNDPQTHHLAILSRYPIRGTASNRDARIGTNHSGTPMHFSRDVSSAIIDVRGIPLRFYNVHFMRAAFDFDRDGQASFRDRVRLAEAQATAAITLRDYPSEQARALPTAVKGSSAGSNGGSKFDASHLKAPPMAFYVIGGDSNSAPRSSEMLAVMRRGTARPLVDPMEGREDISHPQTRTRPDFLAFSPDLARAVIPHSAQVYTGPGDRNASDHRALYADVDLNKLQKLAARSR